MTPCFCPGNCEKETSGLFKTQKANFHEEKDRDGGSFWASLGASFCGPRCPLLLPRARKSTTKTVSPAQTSKSGKRLACRNLFDTLKKFQSLQKLACVSPTTLSFSTFPSYSHPSPPGLSNTTLKTNKQLKINVFKVNLPELFQSHFIEEGTEQQGEVCLESHSQ